MRSAYGESRASNIRREGRAVRVSWVRGDARGGGSVLCYGTAPHPLYTAAKVLIHALRDSFQRLEPCLAAVTIEGLPVGNDAEDPARITGLYEPPGCAVRAYHSIGLRWSTA